MKQIRIETKRNSHKRAAAFRRGRVKLRLLEEEKKRQEAEQWQLR